MCRCLSLRGFNLVKFKLVRVCCTISFACEASYEGSKGRHYLKLNKHHNIIGCLHCKACISSQYSLYLGVLCVGCVLCLHLHICLHSTVCVCLCVFVSVSDNCQHTSPWCPMVTADLCLLAKCWIITNTVSP